MDFGLKYSQDIKGTKKIPKTLIKPNKIYRLLSYEYADGRTETLSGTRATLIFVFGVYKKELHALKLNLVNPTIFFKWLKGAKSGTINESDIKSSDFSKLLRKTDESGQQFFTSQVKGNSVYRIEPRAYRTYKQQNVQSIEEVYFKEEKLIEVFGLPTKIKSEELVDKTADSLRVEKVVKEIEKQSQTTQPGIDDFINTTLDILNKK